MHEAVIWAWLVDVQVYDLFLGVPWMRRVSCTQVYGEGKVSIMGKTLFVIDVRSPIIPIGIGLPTIEFDEDDKTTDQARSS